MLTRGIALTKDGEAKAPTGGSVEQEMFLQKGKIVPDDGETGSYPKRVEILWNGDDANFCRQPNCFSSRPTRARGGVLTGDAQTGTADDSRDIALSFLVTLWWRL